MLHNTNTTRTTRTVDLSDPSVCVCVCIGRSMQDATQSGIRVQRSTLASIRNDVLDQHRPSRRHRRRSIGHCLGWPREKIHTLTTDRASTRTLLRCKNWPNSWPMPDAFAFSSLRWVGSGATDDRTGPSDNGVSEVECCINVARTHDAG